MSKKKGLGLKQRLREADNEQRGAILNGLPYEVGFAKPPQNTRFAAGNQAGKRGRPKNSENLDTIVKEEFDAKVVVTESGKPRKVSKRRVGVRQLANKVASGDMRATALYLELLRKTGRLAEASAPREEALSASDLQAAADLLRFYAPAGEGETDDQGGAP